MLSFERSSRFSEFDRHFEVMRPHVYFGILVWMAGIAWTRRGLAAMAGACLASCSLLNLAELDDYRAADDGVSPPANGSDGARDDSASRDDASPNADAADVVVDARMPRDARVGDGPWFELGTLEGYPLGDIPFVAALGDRVYFGRNRSGSTRYFKYFDVVQEKFVSVFGDDFSNSETQSPIEAGFTGMLISAADGRLHYVASGALSYKPDTTMWDKDPSPPEPRGESVLVSLGDLVFMVGGRDESAEQTPTTTVQTYDVVAKTWSGPDCGAPQCPSQLPFAVKHGCGGAINGRVYVFGGTGLDGNPNRKMASYEPDANAWTALPDLPFGASVRRAPALAWRGQLAVIHAAGDLVELYDPAAKRWSDAGLAVPPGTASPALAVAGPDLYLLATVKVGDRDAIRVYVVR